MINQIAIQKCLIHQVSWEYHETFEFEISINFNEIPL